MKVILLAILIAAKACSTSGGTTFDILCSSKHGEYLRHPYECHKFIRCSHNRAYVFQCPANLLWNHHKTSCDYTFRTICSVEDHETDTRLVFAHKWSAISNSTTKNWKDVTINAKKFQLTRPEVSAENLTNFTNKTVRIRKSIDLTLKNCSVNVMMSSDHGNINGSTLRISPTMVTNEGSENKITTFSVVSNLKGKFNEGVTVALLTVTPAKTFTNSSDVSLQEDNSSNTSNTTTPIMVVMDDSVNITETTESATVTQTELTENTIRTTDNDYELTINATINSAEGNIQDASTTHTQNTNTTTTPAADSISRSNMDDHFDFVFNFNSTEGMLSDSLLNTVTENSANSYQSTETVTEQLTETNANNNNNILSDSNVQTINSESVTNSATKENSIISFNPINVTETPTAHHNMTTFNDFDHEISNIQTENILESIGNFLLMDLMIAAPNGNPINSSNITQESITIYNSSTLIDSSTADSLLQNVNNITLTEPLTSSADGNTETIPNNSGSMLDEYGNVTPNPIGMDSSQTGLPILFKYKNKRHESTVDSLAVDVITQDPRLPFRSIQCLGENNRQQFKASKCYQYYQCFAGWAFLLNCHEGWLFQAENGKCVPDIGNKCQI